jgi:uncharacterized protein (TIGR03437 family)
LRLGIDNPAWRTDATCATAKLEVTRITDGKTFESRRIRVGEDSSISVWAAGLPAEATLADVRIRLNGTDLPAIWLALPEPARQINALLPAGLEPGNAVVAVVFEGAETHPIDVELHQ